MQVRIISKREISGRNGRTGAAQSNREPPVHNKSWNIWIYSNIFHQIVKKISLPVFSSFCFTTFFYFQVIPQYYDIMTVCYYHVTYVFQNEFTLSSYLNVKERLARNRCDIWSLSDSNGIQTHDHLVCKRTLNHLAKLVINGWVFV